MATINFGSIDEVISARRTLHGGGKGKPIKLSDGSLEGAALNKAAVVMISSALQPYFEDVFIECSQKAFKKNFSTQELKNYRATWDRWGNPSSDNVSRLFRRIGVDDVWIGLSWQKFPAKSIKEMLDTINEIRNDIAHGTPLMLKGKAFNLTLSKVIGWRTSIEKLSDKFGPHALGKIS